jgi:two-component system sensor kinase FixL
MDQRGIHRQEHIHDYSCGTLGKPFPPHEQLSENWKQMHHFPATKNGSTFPFMLGVQEVKSSNGNSSFCGYIKDLTQQELDEERLLRREQIASGIIYSAFDPMFQINERGIIQMINQAAIDFICWEREEFLGCNVSMICGGGHSEKHDEHIKRYLRTEEKRVIGK